MIFRRKRSNGATAVAERPAGESIEFSGSDEELQQEIERLTDENRRRRQVETERRVLGGRHLAGIRVLEGAGAAPAHPAPDFERVPEADGLPDIAAEDLTPGLLRAGILRDGSLLVRGL